MQLQSETLNLQLEKVFEDSRGKIIFLSGHQKKINIIEIKKGFARAGHYHKVSSTHHVISGKIEYRQEDIETGKEKIQQVQAPATIFIPKNIAHLLIALEDSIFFESFDKEYEATYYPKYRKIVEEKLKSLISTKSDL